MERFRRPTSRLGIVTPDDEGASVMRREGEYWTIAHAGRLIRLRHSKGLGYLDRLLREPGRSFPVLELAGPRQPRSTSTRRIGTHPPALAVERNRVAVTRAIRNALRKLSHHDPALGALLGSAVRTGASCRYVPGPGLPAAWTR